MSFINRRVKILRELSCLFNGLFPASTKVVFGFFYEILVKEGELDDFLKDIRETIDDE